MAQQQSKRGRKAKTVNFIKKPEESLDNFQIKQTYIIHIPLTLKYLLNSCEKNSNDNDAFISNIYRSTPKPVVPFDKMTTTEDNKETKIKIKTLKNKEKVYVETDKYGNRVDIKIHEKKCLPISDSPDTIKQILVAKTNVACWWCCHTFDTYPVCCPVKYDGYKDLFQAVGCFCSFNCSKSFISKETKGKFYLNSALLKKLKGKLEDVIQAPDRTVLEMFGGPISIDDYRRTFSTLDEININVYPMVFIPSQIEHHKVDIQIKESIDRIKNSKNNKRIVSNKNIESAEERVKINTDSGNSKNSLMNLMNIKITN